MFVQIRRVGDGIFSSLCCVARSPEFSPIIIVIDAYDDASVLQAAIKVSYW